MRKSLVTLATVVTIASMATTQVVVTGNQLVRAAEGQEKADTFTVRFIDQKTREVVGSFEAQDKEYTADVTKYIPAGYAAAEDPKNKWFASDNGPSSSVATFQVAKAHKLTVSTFDSMTKKLIKTTTVDFPNDASWFNAGWYDILPDGYHQDSTVDTVNQEQWYTKDSVNLYATNKDYKDVQLVNTADGSLVSQGNYSSDTTPIIPDEYDLKPTDEYGIKNYEVLNGIQRLAVVPHISELTISYIDEKGNEVGSGSITESPRGNFYIGNYPGLPDGYKLAKTSEKQSIENPSSAKCQVKVEKIEDSDTGNANTTLPEEKLITLHFIDGSGKEVGTQKHDFIDNGNMVYFIYPDGYIPADSTNANGIASDGSSDYTVPVIENRTTIHFVDESGTEIGSYKQQYQNAGERIYFDGYEPKGYLLLDKDIENSGHTLMSTGLFDYNVLVRKYKKSVLVSYADYDNKTVDTADMPFNDDGWFDVEGHLPSGYQVADENIINKYDAELTGKCTVIVAKPGQSTNREIAKLQDQMADLQSKYAQLNSKLTQQPSSNSDESASLKKQIVTLEKNQAELQTKYAKLQSQEKATQSLQSKYDTLQKQFNDLKASQAGGAQNAALQKQVDTLKQQLTDQSKQSATSQAKFDSLQQQINALAKKLNQKTNSQPSATKVTTPVVVTAVAKVNAKTNAPLYDANFKATNRKLAADTSWNVKALVTAKDGKLYYLVGKNQYLRASQAALTMKKKQTAKAGVIKMRGVATVKYVKGYGIQLWSDDFKTQIKDKNGKSRKMMHNSSWKVFATAVKNGHTYYQVGTNQWIDAGYAVLK